jgi:hypothetical protein
MSLLIFAKEDENGVTTLTQIYSKLSPIKCSEARVLKLAPFTGRNANA